MKIPEKDYTHDSFLREVRLTEISGNFNVICFYANPNFYTKKEDFFSIFNYGNNKLLVMGEIIKVTMIAYYGVEAQEINYYLYYDEDNNVILAYTLANVNDMNQTLYRLIKRSIGTYYLPINFTALLKLTNYLKNKFSKMKITYFTAFHHPRFKTKGRHRHDVRRTIIYHGDDGLETMDEMKKYYGTLPRTIEYDLEDHGKYRVNNEGRFSFTSGHNKISSWEVFYDIINYVLEDILTYKRIIEKSEYKIIPYETDEKIFYLPTSTPWIVDFSNNLEDGELDILMNMLDSNRFTLYNASKVYGNSFTLSSMVYDEDKNNKFSMHIDNNKIIIIPYEKKIMESFIKIYEVISDFDPGSILRRDIGE